MRGSSKIQLDENTVNILLKEFVSNDDTRASFQNGHIVIDKQGLKISLTQLPLKQTKLQLQSKFATLNVELADFRLEPTQVCLDLDIGLS